MKLYLKSLATLGPGFDDWDTLRAQLGAAGTLPLEPTTRLQGICLPGVERRRASATVKLAADVAQAALLQSGLGGNEPALVFTSSNGDTHTIHHICEALANADRFVSPTHFHNSVHNAPAGYWSISAGSMQASNTLCAREFSFAVGLLEAAVQSSTEAIPVLLAAFDTPFPEPLHSVQPTRHALGVAMVLSPQPQADQPSLTLKLQSGSAADISRTESGSAIETLRMDSSTGRALPLLAALARCQMQADCAAQTVILEYASDLNLHVTVEPPMPNQP